VTSENISANSKGKRSTVSFMVLFVCVLFVVSVFMSLAYILSHVNHSHDHDGHGGACAVCSYIKLAEGMSKRFHAVSATVNDTVTDIFNIANIISLIPCFCLLTPVILKVRLNS
jgi:hypothetical protein